jgi:hypothetical protein
LLKKEIVVEECDAIAMIEEDVDDSKIVDLTLTLSLRREN